MLINRILLILLFTTIPTIYAMNFHAIGPIPETDAKDFENYIVSKEYRIKPQRLLDMQFCPAAAYLKKGLQASIDNNDFECISCFEFKICRKSLFVKLPIKVVTLQQLLLFKKYHGSEIYSITDAGFVLELNKQDWRIAYTFLDWCVKNCTNVKILSPWIKTLRRLSRAGKIDDDDFDHHMKKLYVLAQYLMSNNNAISGAITKLKKHTSDYNKKVIHALKHLYCCCDPKYCEVFKHTKELRNVRDLVYSWGIEDWRTDVHLKYDVSHRKRKFE